MGHRVFSLTVNVVESFSRDREFRARRMRNADKENLGMHDVTRATKRFRIS
jgi:hypothetical protein